MPELSERPAEFVKELARQAQLLACLKWLSNFQLLACIPLRDTVPISSLAKLANVPEDELCRVVRMAATAGFLKEPKPGCVAHSALSRQFVSKPSLLDAATFLAETAVPAALRMPDATKHNKIPEQGRQSAYSLGTSTSASLAARCEKDPKLRRYVTAFNKLGSSDQEEGVASALASLDWRSLGNAKVVEVGAASLAASNALCDRHAGLQVTVQMRKKPGSAERAQRNPRINVQYRAVGDSQTVLDAAVYILHLPTPTLSSFPSDSVTEDILAELGAHFDMLRLNPTATLMIMTQSLPEPGTVDPDVEALARMQDLLLFQMTNDRALEMSQLLELVDSVNDGVGRLAIVDKRTSRHSITVVLEAQIGPI